jgi:hypothetical protein
MPMRVLLSCLVASALCGCGGYTAPGQPLDNITSMNTEDTGDWRVLSRRERDGRIAVRVAVDLPARAERVARKVIDQQLDRSPSEVAVDVVAASAPEGATVARVVWQRPAHIPRASMPPSADDPRGSVSSDRQGSPERALGMEEH